MKRALQSVIGGSGGLVALGYLNFYWIVAEDGQRVGLFKMDVQYGGWLYSILETLWMPVVIAIRLKTVGLRSIAQRAREALANQPRPEGKEFRLTYFVIFEGYRGQGYGNAFLRLLCNAVLHSRTNDMVADRVTLFVREGNFAAQRLFEKVGFLRQEITVKPICADPFEGERSLGRLLFMERRR